MCAWRRSEKAECTDRRHPTSCCPTILLAVSSANKGAISLRLGRYYHSFPSLFPSFTKLLPPPPPLSLWSFWRLGRCTVPLLFGVGGGISRRAAGSRRFLHPSLHCTVSCDCCRFDVPFSPSTDRSPTCSRRYSLGLRPTARPGMRSHSSPRSWARRRRAPVRQWPGAAAAVVVV